MPLVGLFKRLTTSAGNSSTDLSTAGDESGPAEPSPTSPKCITTAPSASALFPAPTPADLEADAKDPNCSHDCHACPDYPRAFKKIGIDTDDKLWGHIKGWATHAIVATGKTDWIRDVEEIEGSLMMALSKEVSARSSLFGELKSRDKDGNGEEGEKRKMGRMMISASNLPLLDDHEHHEEGDDMKRKTTVILLPRFVVAEGVAQEDAPAIVDYLSAGPSNTDPLIPTPVDSSSSPSASPKLATNTTDSTAADSTGLAVTRTRTATLPPHIHVRPYPHSALILLCSHRYRDARCGISAPILRKEFERHLRPLGLWRDHSDQRPGGVSVVFINHVGGHKYSANCIIYRKVEGEGDGKRDGEVGQGIWLARVAPKDVPGIVRWTVKEGKVMDPEGMLRGGFDRTKGLVSW